MTQFATTTRKTSWRSTASSGRSFGGGFRQFMTTVRAYLGAHRSAGEAETLYQHLSGMSDEELARRGISRSDIPDLVRTHVLNEGGGT